MREIFEQSAQLSLVRSILGAEGFSLTLTAHANLWTIYMYPQLSQPELGLQIQFEQSYDFQYILSETVQYFYKHLNEFKRETSESDQ